MLWAGGRRPEGRRRTGWTAGGRRDVLDAGVWSSWRCSQSRRGRLWKAAAGDGGGQVSNGWLCEGGRVEMCKACMHDQHALLHICDAQGGAAVRFSEVPHAVTNATHACDAKAAAAWTHHSVPQMPHTVGDAGATCAREVLMWLQGTSYMDVHHSGAHGGRSPPTWAAFLCLSGAQRFPRRSTYNQHPKRNGAAIYQCANVVRESPGGGLWIGVDLLRSSCLMASDGETGGGVHLGGP